MSTNPFTAVYSLANPHDVTLGLDAYGRYSRRCAALASQYSVDHYIVCALFAVFSPSNAASTNWIAVERILRADREKTISTKNAIPAYGRDQYRGWQLLMGARTPDEVLTGLKTFNFYLCIRNPDDPRPIVVDGHMANVSDNLPLRRLTDVRLKPVDYHRISAQIRKAAIEAGVLPSRFQAVVWYTWKRIHALTYDQQIRLFEEWDGKVGAI